MDLDAKIELAYGLHQGGRLDETAVICREVLAHAPDDFDALHLLGLVELQRGHPAPAVDLIGRAVAIDPDVAFAQASLGVALHEVKRPIEALATLDRALALEPDLVEALMNRGNVLRTLKRPEDALASYDRALALAPDLADVSINRGNALQDLGRLADALAAYERALELAPLHAVALCNAAGVLIALTRPLEAARSAERALAVSADYPEALCNLGVAHYKLGQWEQALECHERALALAPDIPEAWMNRGDALRDLKRLDEALASCSKAIALKPGHADAHNSHGVVLQRLGRLNEAVASYDKAIALKPDYAEAYSNRGGVLGAMGRFDEALSSYDAALTSMPDFAPALMNRGNALQALGCSDEAQASYDEAIGIQPDLAEAYFNKSLAFLLFGDYGKGWNLHEWRWMIPACPPMRWFRRPLWRGIEPLAGKTILLHSEQGLGDTIQFCRYAAEVRKLGATVILEVQPHLVRLMATLDGVERVVPMGVALPESDFHCPLLSLPLAFGTTLDTIPAGAPYLRADPEKTAVWRRKLGERRKPRVGLCWSGGYRPDQADLWSLNERRNVPLSALGRLNSSGIDFYSLQKGEPAESEVIPRQHELWPAGNFHNFASLLRDFSDTAALVANLDLIISVDTSTAHLAAAMGKPTWILNRFDTCWRWLLDRDDSPWYPTVRLYRQGKKQDWGEVLDRVAEDLLNKFS